MAKKPVPAPVENIDTAPAEVAGGIDWNAILHSADTWILVAFLLFVGIFCKFVLPTILKGLDARSAKIREQLEQASKLRQQAEELLATYQAEREAKLKEGEIIIANAKRDADALRERAAADLKQTLDRRQQQAMDKIARAEQEAVSHIRTQMIDVATEAVRDIVKTQLDSGNVEDPAIARAITAIEKQIH